MNDNDRVRRNLSTALDSVLAALVISGGDLEAVIPTDAIDAALAADPSVETTRQALDVAVRGLREAQAGDDTHQAVLTLEEAANAFVVRSVDAAFRVGLRIGRGMRS